MTVVDGVYYQTIAHKLAKLSDFAGIELGASGLNVTSRANAEIIGGFQLMKGTRLIGQFTDQARAVMFALAYDRSVTLNDVRART
jgi:hypothetical protein